MVSTRGRKPTKGSKKTKPTPDETNTPVNPTTDVQSRKRQRSTAPAKGEVSPASKRRATAIALSQSTARENGGASPRVTRHQPLAHPTPCQEGARGDSNAPDTSTALDDIFVGTTTPNMGSVPFADASNGNLDFAIHSASLVDYASQGYDQMGMVDTASFLPQGASLHVKIQSLPVLDNLATQILNIIAKSSYLEVINMALKPDSEPGKTFTTLKDLFNHAKKVYSQTEPFLDAYALRLVDNAHIDTVRKANMATFVISILGSQDVGFYHLNEYFLDTFVPKGHQPLKTQTEIYLELKTQAYISAIMNSQRSREAIIEDLFPQNLEKILLERRAEAKQLSPSEKDFIQRAQNRRKVLLEEPDTVEAIQALPEKYVWADFLKEVSTYVSRHFDVIANEPARKTPRPQRPNPNGKNPSTPHQAQGDNIADKAQRAALVAMQDYGPGRPVEGMNPPELQPYPTMREESSQKEPVQNDQPEIQFHFERPLHPNVPGPQKPYFHSVPFHPEQGQWYPGTPSDPNWIPYPTQSAPTNVLYERARMVSSSKPSGNARKTGGPAQRRPWTLEEENALMAGLDRVKGPHWAQILAMFGPGGTISEILKDRGQVQLKDKARNLKLFFLKSNIEVPYYLQFVTGELKTRAPATAAKREAMEKQISDEDRAHVEGIMALANAPQQFGGEIYDPRPADSFPRQRKLAQSDANVDPNLDAIQQDESAAAAGADYLVPSGGNVAPSADMLSGRQNISQEQFRQSQQHLQPQQPGGFHFPPESTSGAPDDPVIGVSIG